MWKLVGKLVKGIKGSLNASGVSEVLMPGEPVLITKMERKNHDIPERLFERKS
jgi:hypothetical protein